MLKIGDKIRVKYNYWEICKKLYKDSPFPIQSARNEMSKAIGKEFIIKDKKNNIHLLVDDNGETDGFAWDKEFLEKV